MTSSSPASGRVSPVGSPWPGVGPFLFTAHHVDHYPRGNDELGPADDISHRPIGSDFGNPAGWNMYHGDTVPGFPAHPHRGFETITVVSRGVVDHADSTGASARYADGDVQWVTAGAGVSHSEMFPLLHADRDNPFELYQIWLNLPARDKGADPEFTIAWSEDIPVVTNDDGTARAQVIAGRLGDAVAVSTPVRSWAADPQSDLAVWLIDLAPDAEFALPDVGTDRTQRTLYVHDTDSPVSIAGSPVAPGQAWEQATRGTVAISAGDTRAKVLVLQGVPIDEPVAAQGPFVMNTRDELAKAFDDYQRTRFGGWPWPTSAPVFDRDTERFARHSDGRVERPGTPVDAPA